MLTDEMSQIVNNAFPKYTCLVATASKSGVPNIGFKGSVMVFDSESLAYWERTRGTTLKNLEENPQIMVFVREPTTRKGWRFLGNAQIYRDGETREEIWKRTIQDEKERDPEKKGFGVIIKVQEIQNASDPTRPIS